MESPSKSYSCCCAHYEGALCDHGAQSVAGILDTTCSPIPNIITRLGEPSNISYISQMS